MATSNGKIRLSPSALNIYLECQKCFWLEYKAGIHRPRGPFPSLPGGMDILIKKYFDSYRAVGKLPPEIVNQLNCYSFLLAANEFKQPSYAYLIYFIPREVKIGGSVIFSVEVKKVSTSIEAARKTFEKAALLLRGEAPTSHSECQFCSWSRNI